MTTSSKSRSSGKRRRHVLVLDASETPLSTTTILRAEALTKLGTGADRAVILETAHMDGDGADVPAVIKLTNLVDGFIKSVALASARVFFRDDHTCQYCGEQKPVRELTLDHVFPKSRGGDSSWENLTTACKKCNNKKADRTPEEAGMKLLSLPAQPRDTLVFELMVRNQPHLARAWVRYLKQLDAELSGA
jgi:hypothetical protein